MEVASLLRDPSNWPVFSAETFPTENWRPIEPVSKAVEELLPHGIKVEKWLIPAVPANIRGTSSWPPHFRGEEPRIEVIDFLHPEHKETRGW